MNRYVSFFSRKSDILPTTAKDNGPDTRRRRTVFCIIFIGIAFLLMTTLVHLYSEKAVQTIQRVGNLLNPPTIEEQVNGIMNPADNASIDRLSCPLAIEPRYDALRANESEYGIKYFFALDLYNCASILPTLLGSVVESIRFLGPEFCSLSIVEGRSTDGTDHILQELQSEMEAMRSRYYLGHSESDPKDGSQDRILALANLRNQALQPLIDNRHLYATDALVIFLNDVVCCPDDILELLHQQVLQGADMSCGMDWNDKNNDVLFYDVWVARAINGDTFFEVPQNSEWNFAANLFWNEPNSKRKWEARESFQVFACWNGGVVFRAQPVMDGAITFRRSADGECVMGEPTLFCKDLWRMGTGKIQVVPTVNFAYTVREGRQAKAVRGRVEQGNDVLIDWQLAPPAMLKCARDWFAPTWIPPLS